MPPEMPSPGMPTLAEALCVSPWPDRCPWDEPPELPYDCESLWLAVWPLPSLTLCELTHAGTDAGRVDDAAGSGVPRALRRALDVPLLEPSVTLQLVPSACATPVAWLLECEVESVCDGFRYGCRRRELPALSVWDRLVVWLPPAELPALSVCDHPVESVTPCETLTPSVTDWLSVCDMPWLVPCPTLCPHDDDSL